MTGSWCTGPHRTLTSGGSEAGSTGAPTPNLARTGLSLTLSNGSSCTGPSLAPTSCSSCVGLPAHCPSAQTENIRPPLRPSALAEQLPLALCSPVRVEQVGMEVAQLPPSGCLHPWLKGAEVGCSLAGLTLGAGMGAVWTSATPMQLRDAGGGVGEELITQATCLTCQQPAGMSIFYIQTSAG